MVQQACVNFSLQQLSIVLAATIFVRREDVDAVRLKFNAAFDPAEEIAADEMAQTVYWALVSLHAAVTCHLYQTARPLPQMLQFRFAATRPTLVQSYRLYTNAGRADEMRAENKVVHPAFAPRQGRALSFEVMAFNPAEIAGFSSCRRFQDWETVWIQHRWSDGWPLFPASPPPKTPRC